MSKMIRKSKITDRKYYRYFFIDKNLSYDFVDKKYIPYDEVGLEIGRYDTIEEARKIQNEYIIALKSS